MRTFRSCWSSDRRLEFSSLNLRYATPRSVQTRGVPPGRKVSASCCRNRRSNSSAMAASVASSAAGTTGVPARSGLGLEIGAGQVDQTLSLGHAEVDAPNPTAAGRGEGKGAGVRLGSKRR